MENVVDECKEILVMGDMILTVCLALHPISNCTPYVRSLACLK